MKAIKFKENASQKIYDNYIKRVKRITNSLLTQDSNEILLEINSHIYEGTQNVVNEEEIDTLLNVLDRLGEPEVVLKPLVADKKLAQATKSLNPIHIFKALFLNIGNGMAYFIFSILYLSLFGFVYAIIIKIINPKEVGLWFQNGSLETLGTYKGFSPEDNVVEVLGNWFIPVMLLCAISLFIIITFLLKLKHQQKK
ncbi:MAG: hypothetical protein AB8B78_13025 [Polaribacter sp.]